LRQKHLQGVRALQTLARNNIYRKVTRDVENDIEDVFDVEDIGVNVGDRFVEVVSIHTFANINILVANNFVGNVECVSILIIVKKKYVKIIIGDFINIVEDIFVEIVSTIFFA
jgi:hypothetical protein